MPFSIHPVLPTDAQAWVELQFDAFASDPLSPMLYPVPASTSIRKWSADQLRQGWGMNPLERRLKIVDDETGDMVAVALWFFVPARELKKGEGKGEEVDVVPPQPKMEYHEEYVKEAWDQLMGSAWRTRHEIMGGKAYIFLCDLLTLPKYCRQGAATLLLKWGLHQATEANLPVYLTASPSGLPLYTKHNFRSVRKVPIYRPLNSTTVLQVNTGMILDAPHPSSPPTVSPADAGKFFLEPVTQEADFHKMAKIESLAFTEDLVIPLCFPPDPENQGLQHRGAELFKDHSTDPTTRYAKATDLSTGEIVAWAEWKFYDSPRTEPYTPIEEDYGPTANGALCNYFFGALDQQRHNYMKGKTHCLLTVLATLPEYQRKGIGSQLLRRGLEEADEKGYESWINASPQGLELYKRHGWEEVGFVDINIGEWGGKEGIIDRTVGLVRKPKMKS